jgi:hypothetical protein
MFVEIIIVEVRLDVALVKFTPRVNHTALNHFDRRNGVVEETGLGHSHTDLIA